MLRGALLFGCSMVRGRPQPTPLYYICILLQNNKVNKVLQINEIYIFIACFVSELQLMQNNNLRT